METWNLKLTPKHIYQALTVLLGISILTRLIASLALGNQVTNLPGTADQLSYHTLALQLLRGEGFSFPVPWWPATAAGAPTAHWSFLYTFFLAGVYKLFGPNPLAARIIQSILVGLLQPWLTYLIGRRLFGPLVGLTAAGITGIYAYFIYYSATLMTEPFYITLILGALYLTLELVERLREGHPGSLRLSIYLGLVLGATVLFRQLFLVMIPVLFLWIVWRTGWRAVRSLALASILIAVCILPFTLYNTSRFHRVVLLNTNAGFALFWGNHPIHGTHFIPILPDDVYMKLVPRELLGLDEAALERELLSRGIGFVLDDPGRFVALSISRIPAYFMFWPSTDSGLVSNLSRVLSFGLFLPFMVYGLIQSFRFKSQAGLRRIVAPQNLLFLFFLAYTGLHLLSWALIRYRLPVDAILVVYAGLGVVDLAARWLPMVSRGRTRGIGQLQA